MPKDEIQKAKLESKGMRRRWAENEVKDSGRQHMASFQNKLALDIISGSEHFMTRPIFLSLVSPVSFFLHLLLLRNSSMIWFLLDELPKHVLSARRSPIITIKMLSPIC
jgi:hypothetical protein